MVSYTAVLGQGTVRGKITDNNGEALIGAAVILKANKAIGVTTDLDGNYSIKINDTTPQVLIISYVSYKTQEITVNPRKGEVIVKDIIMASASDLEEVVVEAKASKANNNYLEKMKMKSSSTVDFISQETMKRTGDVSVVNAVARVSGVSSSSNAGFITVRGIGDRYVKTTLNGMRIPTLDPYTNNIRLDLFPANLVDNIILTKTASPDIPGDWAGAYLSIETKDYPDKLQIYVESAVGYNTQSTFKDVLSSKGSSTDWLGFDNGLRGHTHNANGASAIANMNPTDYQNFVALGLGSYYSSLGINGSPSQWNSTTANTYFNLGLVQLGLLQNSQLGDQAAITNATAAYYNGPYQSQAFNTLNAPAVKLGQSFADNWNTTTRKGPLNLTQSFSIGNQVTLFGKPLGFLVGFRYGNNFQYDPNSVANRANYDRSLDMAVKQQVSTQTNGWSALANLAYKYSPNHSISLVFMPNFTGMNNVRNSVDSRDPSQWAVTQTQFYEQRRQLIYQLKSEHYVPKPQIKIELDASYTGGKSSAPDFKDVTYWKSSNNTDYQIGGTIGNGVHRYYRYLTDNLFDSRLFAEMPLGKSTVGPRKIKIGGGYQYNAQKRDQYDYNMYFNGKSQPAMTSDDLNQYFSLNNFAIQNGSLNFYYFESGSPANHTFGNSSIISGYAMTDYTIIKPLRFSGGLRVEKAKVFTDVFKYDSLHYAKDDPRRTYVIGLPLANPGKLDNLAFLPSANVIYKLKDDEDAPVNLRANFSQTIARPSIREMSDVAVYDYALRSFVFGNSDLKPVSIKNYDLRLEWYFKNRDNVSASVFYKDFRNHIEIVNFGSYTWQNVDKSYVGGLEIDGRKVITKNFEIMSNITLAKSNTSFTRTRLTTANGVKQYVALDHVSRPMFGQAPYIINAILIYNAPEKLGLSATLSYNRQGPRLAISAGIKEIPDVYEMPRNMFDFKVSKKLGKYFTATLTIRDILNTAVQRTYLYSDGTRIDYDKFRYGTNYVVGVTYKL